MPIKDLNPAERFIWEWRRGRMSDFRRALIHIIQRADVHNLEQLRLGFPNEVEGYVSYRLIPGWWDDLEKRMAREEPEEDGEDLCDSCALDKHSCIDVEGRPEITECPNHIFKEAESDHEPDGLDLYKREMEAVMQEEAKT